MFKTFWNPCVLCCVQLLSRVWLYNLMDCSPPGSPIHGILQARILEWVAMPSSRGSSQPRGQTQGLLHCRWILYHLSHQGSPIILEWAAYPFSKGSSWPRNQTRVSCIAGRFFTSWATREAQYCQTNNKTKLPELMTTPFISCSGRKSWCNFLLFSNSHIPHLILH